VPDVENRRAVFSERRQQFYDPRNRLGIVSPFARGFPLIERALHVDDDQCGQG
jgi:hypothetical protein